MPASIQLTRRSPWFTLASLACLAVALGGCATGDTVADRSSERIEFEVDDVPESGTTRETGLELGVTDSFSKSAGLDGPIGSASEDLSDTWRPSGDEMVGKSDIYWKLNYFKQSLEAGQFPDEMAAELDELEPRIHQTEDDEIKALLLGAARNYRTGLEAKNAEQGMVVAGVDAKRIHWGSGRSAMEADLVGSKSTAGRARAGARITPETVAAITAFEGKHRASPARVKESAFRSAGESVSEVAELLGLAGREENSAPGTAKFGDDGKPIDRSKPRP